MQRPSILAECSNAGISKKQAKEKPKSRAQRQRQKKGMERAEAVLDQLENKVSRSVKKGKTIKARRVCFFFIFFFFFLPGGEKGRVLQTFL